MASKNKEDDGRHGEENKIIVQAGRAVEKISKRGYVLSLRERGVDELEAKKVKNIIIFNGESVNDVMKLMNQKLFGKRVKNRRQRK